MRLDVSDLLKKKVAKKTFDLDVADAVFNENGELITPIGDAKFKGTVSLVGNILNLTGLAKVDLNLSCSRCTESFNYAAEVDIDEKFTTDIANKDEDVIFLDSDSINITEIIENNVLFSLPMKRLCKEDCKGLCQKCGANLNYSSCKCKDDDIDPRLARLRDLLSNS